jgi:hypothetical protein
LQDLFQLILPFRAGYPKKEKLRLKTVHKTLQNNASGTAAIPETLFVGEQEAE